MDGHPGELWFAWHNLWLRAGLFHPVIAILPAALVCLAFVEPGGDRPAYGLWLLPLAAIVSIGWTIRFARLEPRRRRMAAIGLAVLAAVIVWGMAGLAWLEVKDVVIER